jgi:hypothetical protein
MSFASHTGSRAWGDHRRSPALSLSRPGPSVASTQSGYHKMVSDLAIRAMGAVVSRLTLPGRTTAHGQLSSASFAILGEAWPKQPQQFESRMKHEALIRSHMAQGACVTGQSWRYACNSQ